MNIFFRGLRFVKRYLLTNPKYVVTYILVFWQKNFSFKTSFMSESELRKQVQAGRSIIRLGDGEINLMLGLRNHYQKFSPELKKSMYSLVKNYDDDSGYILAIPRFVNCTNEELIVMGKFQVWLPLKVVFWLYFNKHTTYLDAHCFYYDGYFERVVAPVIKDKHVVLITREETVEAQKLNKYIPWQNMSYIVTPPKDALDMKEEISILIDKELKDKHRENIILLFAMGPVGKSLISEYERKGVQGIDIGLVAEVMFTRKSIQHII